MGSRSNWRALVSEIGLNASSRLTIANKIYVVGGFQLSAMNAASIFSPGVRTGIEYSAGGTKVGSDMVWTWYPGQRHIRLAHMLGLDLKFPQRHRSRWLLGLRRRDEFLRCDLSVRLHWHELRLDLPQLAVISSSLCRRDWSVCAAPSFELKS